MDSQAPVGHSLTPYVPQLLIDRLQVGRFGGDQPVAEQFPGIYLFVDIVGFSQLTNSLMEHGPRGAEELSGILNTYFRRQTTTIFAHGGEVITFAGDAILAFWNAEEDWALASRCAAQCSLALREGARELKTEIGVALQQRIATDAGSILLFQVGGVGGRWHYVVGGHTLGEVHRAYSQVQPDEILIGPALWTHLAPYCHGKRGAVGTVSLDRVHQPVSSVRFRQRASSHNVEALLARYVPEFVIERLRLGQEDWLAGFRTLSIVFVNLLNLDCASPQVLPSLHTAIRSVQQELHRLDGRIYQVVVDDKGANLVAVFGVPPFAHEDDPVRAIEAGLAIRDALHAHAIRTAIGVTTGRMFCGDCGGEYYRQYSIRGAAINLAARLMQQAPDNILCDAPTTRAAGARMVFSVPREAWVKGQSQSTPIYRPQGKVAARQLPSRKSVVGRDPECQEIARYLHAAVHGEGGVLIFQGEAGIGKSQLLTHCTGMARQQGIRVLVGLAATLDSPTPYFAWRDIVLQLLLKENDRNGESSYNTHLGQLRADATLLPWAPLLNDVLHLQLPESPLTSQLSGTVRAAKIHGLLVELLQANPDIMPTVLIFDDAHLLDAASVAVLRTVTQQLPTVLVVMAMRPLDQVRDSPIHQLATAPTTVLRALAPLSPDAITDIIRHTLGVVEVPDVLSHFIFSRAEGNPLYSEELALSLRESGGIVVAGDKSRLGTERVESLLVTLPNSLQGTIVHRVDQLRPEEQLVVKVASVIGRVFDRRLVSEVYPVPEDIPRLDLILEQLIARDLVHREGEPSAGRYRFKHLITQEVIYDLLPFTRRQKLHTDIAQWLERTYADDLSQLYSQLAWHWKKAEITTKAVAYLEKAGELALRAGAHAEAKRFFTELLETPIVMTPPDNASIRQACWAWHLGTACAGLGDLHGAADRARQALQGVGWLCPTTQWGWFRILPGQVLAHVGTMLSGRFGQTKNPRKRERLLISAGAATVLSETHYFFANVIPFVVTSVLAINHAEQAGNPASVARPYGSLGYIAGLMGLHRVARYYFQRPRRACEATGDLVGLLNSLGGEAMYDISLGRWTQAGEILTRVLSLCRQVGDPQNTEMALTLLGLSEYYQGHFAVSHGHFVEVCDSATRRENTQHKEWGAYAQAENLIPLGCLEQSRTQLECARKALTAVDDHHSKLICDGLLAIVYLRLGHWREACRLALAGMKRARDMSPNNFGSLEGFAMPAEVFLLAWHRARVNSPRQEQRYARLAKSALAPLTVFARLFPIGLPRLWLYRGWHAWNCSQAAKARKAWLYSLRNAERLGMVYEQARAHQVLAACTTMSLSERTHHAQRAETLARSLGAMLYPLPENM